METKAILRAKQVSKIVYMINEFSAQLKISGHLSLIQNNPN